MDPLYALLRHLTLPLVAVTASEGGRRNGLIVNSAQRASLVPSLPRVSLYISKPNFTHDLVYRTGVLGVHLLRPDQWGLVERLGLRSGRDGDKLEGVPMRIGAATSVPLLEDAHTTLECRVVNAMDAGAATFFLADVVATSGGAAGSVMTSDHFRSTAPAELLRQYQSRLEHAQRMLAEIAGGVDRTAVWPGPQAEP